MLEIKFKECCNDCGNRETYVNESKLSGDGEVVAVVTVIGCEHENVCKEYLESKED